MAVTLTELLPVLARLSRTRDRGRSLGELAEALNRSPPHAQRVFKRLVGESAKQYDKRLRLEWAAIRLLSTPTPVLEIALDVGFESHEGFTRAFSAHFGLAPREFRLRGLSAPQHREAHCTAVERVGPCVGLFRADTASRLPEERMDPDVAQYDVTQRALDPVTFLFRSRRCRPTEIAAALGEILPSVFRYATESGFTLVGPPVTRYRAWGPALLTLEAGLPVAEGAKGEGDIQLGSLQGGTVASTVHRGPYEGLHAAHAAVELWLEAEGLRPGGAAWEVYLTDPGEVPDPADWMTEVIWPIA